MADVRYFDALLQVPAAEVPDDATVAQRPFSIQRHGGMILVRIGPIDQPGHEGEAYSVLLSTGQAQAIINTIEVIRANLGR